jgi:hypothetical protein
MSDSVYDFTRRVVQHYALGRSLANLIFYHDATAEEKAAIRMTCRLIEARLSPEQIDDIRKHAQIDLRNPAIPTKGWLRELEQPRPGRAQFIVGFDMQHDHDDCYDEIMTAGAHLPESRPWNPDKPRYWRGGRMVIIPCRLIESACAIVRHQ